MKPTPESLAQTIAALRVILPEIQRLTVADLNYLIDYAESAKNSLLAPVPKRGMTEDEVAAVLKDAGIDPRAAYDQIRERLATHGFNLPPRSPSTATSPEECGCDPKDPPHAHCETCGEAMHPELLTHECPPGFRSPSPKEDAATVDDVAGPCVVCLHPASAHPPDGDRPWTQCTHPMCLCQEYRGGTGRKGT